MRTVDLVLHQCPDTMQTYGTLWKLPRMKGDRPVIDVVVTPQGAVPVQLEAHTSYAYVFSYSGHDSGTQFRLDARCDAAVCGSKKFTIGPMPARVFRFRTT